MEPLKDNRSSVFAVLVGTALLCVAIAVPFVYDEIESARALRAQNDSVEVDFRQMLLYYDRPKTRAESLQIGLLGKDNLSRLTPAARVESLQVDEERLLSFLARSARNTSADSVRRVQRADSFADETSTTMKDPRV
jgi:hypothetical protein